MEFCYSNIKVRKVIEWIWMGYIDLHLIRIQKVAWYLENPQN